MKKIFFIILAIIPTFLFAQDTKKIRDKESNETFYVIKSDKTIKHGEYKKFGFNDRLLINGFYKQGVKDSVWECYDFEGQLTLKYNYSKNEVVFYKPSDKVKGKQYRVLNSSNGTDTVLSRPPIYLGGEEFIWSEVAKHTKYPTAAAEHGESGKVYVAFTVDKFGKTKNFHVQTPIGFGMDEESIRVFKLIPDNWLPGLVNEQPVDVEVVYPMTFILQ